MNNRLTEAVEALLVDGRIVADFRSRPAVVGERFGLSADEVEALKTGDEARLLGLGMDPAVLSPRIHRERSWSSTILRVAARAATPLVAALLIALASAGTARADTDGARTTVGRLSARVLGRASVRAGQRADLGEPLELTSGIRAQRAGLTSARVAIPSSKELP